jgi:hypothetical protein
LDPHLDVMGEREVIAIVKEESSCTGNMELRRLTLPQKGKEKASYIEMVDTMFG